MMRIRKWACLIVVAPVDSKMNSKVAREEYAVWSVEETFRRLTIGEPGLLDAIAVPGDEVPATSRLDGCGQALVLLGALIAVDAQQSSYQPVVESAQEAGATIDDLLAVLLAVAGVVGSARVVSAAPRIAVAAGYDVQAALEGPPR